MCAVSPAREAVSPLPLRAFDFVEVVTGGARQTAYYLRAAFGFQLIAYRGSETSYDRAPSFALQQGRIRILVTEGRGAGRVHAIGFTVDSARECYDTAIARGALSASAVVNSRDNLGETNVASIATSEGLIYSFVERGAYRGAFLPGFEPGPLADPASRPVGLLQIDNIAFAVDPIGLEDWRRFHAEVLGPSPLHFDAVHPEPSASAVQIGVTAANAAHTIQRLRAQGVDFASASIARSVLDGDALSFAITQAVASH